VSACAACRQSTIAAPAPSAAGAYNLSQIQAQKHVAAHILYKKEAHSLPLEGRIVKANPGSAIITTNTATAEAMPSQLAPYLPSGSEVALRVRLCLLLRLQYSLAYRLHFPKRLQTCS
jgi:hypothetical protein